MMHGYFRIFVPGAACALALATCLLAGCGSDESSASPADKPQGARAKPRETFRSPSEYMKDPAFQKAVTAGRRKVDEAVAVRDRVAAQMRAKLAEAKAKLGTNVTDAAAFAALEKDVVWTGLKNQLKDAETAAHEAQAKLYAAAREGMKKASDKISK